jgi:hypothetical protein
MRSLSAVAVIVLVFGATVFVAGGAFGVWKSASTQAGRAAGDTPTPKPAPGQRAHQKRERRAEAAVPTTAGAETQHRFSPRERLTRRDTAIARTAVVDERNLAAWWHHDKAHPGPTGDCAELDPALSRLTVTGKAQSALKSGHGASIASRIRIFRTVDEAHEYFRLTSGPRTLQCLRRGVASFLREVGITAELFSSSAATSRAFGNEAIVYRLRFWMHGLSDPNRRYEYPVEVYTFRRDRAFAATSFSFVAAKADEVGGTRIVDARLGLALYKQTH